MKMKNNKIALNIIFITESKNIFKKIIIKKKKEKSEKVDVKKEFSASIPIASC